MVKTRKSYSLAEKVKILNKIEKFKPRPTVKQMSEILNIPRSTIASLLKNENHLREEAKSISLTIKKKRHGKNPEIERALRMWFKIVVKRGISISGPLLKEKADNFARELNHLDFKATDGWLSRWKKREGIKYKRAHGEKGSANTELAANWISNEIPKLLEEYSPKDIYNADETGLYYRAMPDGSLTFRSENLVGSKRAMDRITVLCCANMTGEHKMELLVIGKSAKPRCFKGVSMSSLPVQYHANKKAWMTSFIFSNWIINWNDELKKNNRKILLLVDNCSAHPQLDLSNIELKFLPPNTTSITQPMDMGVIKNLKMAYRSRLVKYTLDLIEKNLASSDLKAREISSKITLSGAISFLSDSWRLVATSTIQNCFKHCGLQGLNPESSIEKKIDVDMFLAHKVVNADSFLGIDENLQCYDETEPDLVKQISETIKQNNDAEENNEEPAIEEPAIKEPAIEMISDATAKDYVEHLRNYFMREGNESSPRSALDLCYDFVMKQ